MKRTILLLALAASPLMSPALGQSGTSGQAQRVSTAGLDLSRESDVRRLDRRIAAAAVSLCGPMSDIDPVGKRIVRRCRRDAVQGAAAARDLAIAARSTAPATVMAGR